MSSSQKDTDEKVISLKFDNSNFEKNVKTSLSTLETLKSSLNFKGISDGIKKFGGSFKNAGVSARNVVSSFRGAATSIGNISKAVSKVSFAPLNKEIQEVHNNFSALDVMAATALSNITNSAVNAGKRFTKAITIEPVKSGFQEYETQINAIQTILSNTRSKGSTLEDVNRALDELNKYADMTIYNFTEMTKNIGRFTAAGVDLQTSVNAIKGIANLAAVSGSTSEQASSAMYQLSQAIAAGRVGLMDWNSVVNAGMGGELFQQALIRTSEHLQTGAQAAIDTYGSFRESLTKGAWLTTEVLTETLNQISGAYSKADLLAQGYTEDQANEITALAEDAVNAATKVKTLTQLFDTMSEAIQSGWTQTWELIIGDFEEARQIFTEISNFFNEIIETMSEARNKILKGAIDPFGLLEDILAECGIDMKTFEMVAKIALEQQGMSLDDLIAKYGDFESTLQSGWLTGDMFNNILSMITGDTEGAEEAIAATSKTLEDYQQVVNDVILGKYGNIDTGRFQALEAAGWDAQAIQDLVNQQLWYGEFNLENLTDEQLVALDLTEEQIAKVRELGQEALNADSETGKLLDNLTKEKSGNELIFDSVMNTLTFIQKILDTVGGAFSKVFGSIDSGEVYNFIEGINRFTEDLANADGPISNFGNLLEGVFTIVKLGFDGAKGVFDWVVGLVDAFKEAMGLDISDEASNIGDALKDFDSWVRNSGIVTFLQDIGNVVKDYILPLAKPVGAIFGQLEGMFGSFTKIFDNLFDDLFALKDNFTFDGLYSAFVTFFDSITATVKNWGGPIWDIFIGMFSNIGSFFDGIVKEIEGAFSSLDKLLSESEIVGPFYNQLKDIFGKISSFINLDPIITNFTNLKTSVDTVFSNIGSAFETFFGALRSMKDNVTLDGLISAFSGLVSGIIGAFDGSSLVDGFISSIRSIGSIILNVVSGIVDLIKSKLSEISSNTSNPFSGVAGFFLGLISVLQSVPEQISGIISSVTSIFSSVDLPGISGIFDWLAHALGPTKAYALGISSTVDTVGEAADKVGGAVENVEEVVASAEGASINFDEFLGTISDAFSGFSDTMASVFAVIGPIFEDLKYFFENYIGSSGVFAIGLTFVFLKMLSTFSDTVGNVTKTFNTFGDVLKDSLKNVTDVLGNFGKAFTTAADSWGEAQKKLAKAEHLKSVALVLLSLAGVLAIFAVSMYVFSQLNDDQLKQGLIALGALVAAMLLLGVIAVAIVKLTATANPTIILGIAAAMISLAGSLLVVALALKILDYVNPELIIKNVAVLLVTFGLIVGAMIALSRFGLMVDISAKSILSFSAVILSIALALKMMADINFLNIENIIISLVTLFTGMSVLMALAKGVKLGASIGLLAMIGSIVLAMEVVSKLENYDPMHIIDSIPSFIGLFVGLTILMGVTRLAGKHAAKGGIAILLITASLYLMLPLITMLGDLRPETATQGLQALFWMILFVDSLLVAAGQAGKHAIKAGIAMNLIMVPLIVISFLAIMLGKVDSAAVEQGVTAMMGLIFSVSGLLLAIGGMGKLIGKKTNVVKPMTRMLLILVALATSIAVLAYLDTDTVQEVAMSLASVIATVAIVFLAISQIPDTKGVNLKMMSMLAIIVVIAAVLTAMSILDISGTIENALALGSVMVALAIAMKIIEGIKSVPIAVVGSILLLTVALIPIAASLMMLASYDWNSILAAAASLAIVIASIAGVTVLLGALLQFAYTGAGALVLIAGAMAIFSVAAIGFAFAMSILAGVDGDLIYDSLSKLASGIEAVGNVLFAAIAAAVGIAVLSVSLGIASVGLALFAGGLGLASLAINAFAGAVSSVLTVVSSALVDTSGQMQNAGSNIMLGLAAGMLGAIAAPFGAVAAVATGIIGTFCSLLGIHSPSVVGEAIGGFIDQGLGQGLAENFGFISGPIDEITGGITSKFEALIPDAEAIGGKFMEGLGNNLSLDSFMGRQTTTKFGKLVDSLTLDQQQKQNIINENEQFSADWANSLIAGTDNLDYDVSGMYNGMSQGFFGESAGEFGPSTEGIQADADEKGQVYATTYGETLKKFVQYGIEQGWFTPEEISAELGILYDPNMSDEEFVKWINEKIDSGEYRAEVEVAINAKMGPDFFQNSVMDMIEEQLKSGQLDPNQVADSLGIPHAGKMTAENLIAYLNKGLAEGTIDIDQLLSTLDQNGIETLFTVPLKNSNKAVEGSIEKAQEYYETALECIKGIYGDGEARVKALKEAGFTDEEIAGIQALIDKMYELNTTDLSSEQIQDVVDDYVELTAETEEVVDNLIDIDKRLDAVNKKVVDKRNADKNKKRQQNEEKLEKETKELDRPLGALEKEDKTPFEKELEKNPINIKPVERKMDVTLNPRSIKMAKEGEKALQEGVDEILEDNKESKPFEGKFDLSMNPRSIKMVQEGEEALQEFADGVTESFEGVEVPQLVDKAYADELETNTEAVTNSSKNMETNVSKAANDAATAMEDIRRRTKDTTNNMVKDSSLGGKAMPNAMSSGIDSNKGQVAGSVNAVHDVTRAPFSNSYNEWYRYGSNMGDGLVQGLSAKEPLIKEKAAQLGLAANNAFTEAEEIHSPSEIWKNYGQYIGQGLTNGMMSQTASVLEASETLSDSASYGITDTLSKIDFSTIKDDASYAITEALKPLNKFDFDSLDANPVIRPVLDLTDIESKAATIGSMFASPSLSIKGLPDLGSSIGKNQNGSEILKALNDLKGSMGQNVTNYNSIGNIIYDEDSSIASAIETIVQETIVEGRM